MKNKFLSRILAFLLTASMIFSAVPIAVPAFAQEINSHRVFSDDFKDADFTASNWQAVVTSAYNGDYFKTNDEAAYTTTEDGRTVLRASDGGNNTNNIGDVLSNMPTDRRVESVTATFKQPRDLANEDASSGIVAFHINSRNSLVLCVYPYVNSKNAEDPNNDYIYYSWCRYSYATADTKNAKNNCVEIYNDQVTNIKKWRYSTGLVGDNTDWLTVTLTYDYSQIANNILTVSATLKDEDGNEGTIPAFSAKFDNTVYDCTDADGNVTESAAYLAYDENFKVGIAGSGVNYYCYYDSFSVQYSKSFSELAGEFKDEYSEALNLNSISSNEQFDKAMEAYRELNMLPANVKNELTAENSKLSGLMDSYKITYDDFENSNLFGGVWESIPYTGDIMTWNTSESSFVTGTTSSGTVASIAADAQNSTNNVLVAEQRNISRKRKMLTLKENYMRSDAQLKSLSTDFRADSDVTNWDASPGIYYYYKDVYNWGRIEYYVSGTVVKFRVIEQAGTSTGENMLTITRVSNTTLSETSTPIWYNFKVDYAYNEDSTTITLTVTEKSSGTVVTTKNFTSEYIIDDDFKVGYGSTSLASPAIFFDNFELGYYKTADEFRAEYAETLNLTTSTVTVNDTKAVLDVKEAMDGLTNKVKAELNREVIHLTRLYNKILQLKTLDTVYLSATGNDANDGTQNAPVATLDKAYQWVKDGGTIHIVGTYTLAQDFVWNNHGKTVTISGGTLDGAALSKGLILGEPVTFENITLQFDAKDYIYANGHKLVMGENVVITNAINLFGGGVSGTTVESTDLTVLSGSYMAIYGGSNSGDVTGDTNLYIGGNVNSAICTALNHENVSNFYGGGYGGTVGGSTNIVFTDNALSSFVVGGGAKSNVVEGGTNIEISGSSATYGVYGGTKDGSTVNGDINIVVKSGSMADLFGASGGTSYTGNVNIQLLGGNVVRRVYGGCYNGVGRSGLSIAWDSSYYVNGNITLFLSSNANVSMDGINSQTGSKYDDRSLYVRSRQYTVSSNEKTYLVYADKAAYDKYKDKTGPQDSNMTLIMKNSFLGFGTVRSASDNIYYCSYAANGATITQSFTKVSGSVPVNGTVTVSIDNNVSTEYTKQPIKAAKIVKNDTWVGPVPEIAYSNNIEVGTATASITSNGSTASTTFQITEDLTPAILGGSISKSESQDIRFSCQFALTDKKVKEYGVIIAYYNRITNGDVALADMTVQTDNRYVTVGKVTLEMPASKSGQMFYANIGKVPPTSYGYRYVARIFVKYEGDDTYYYSDGGNGSIESATGVENGYICRSVISIAKSILSWTYDNYEKMDDEYGVSEITEIISGKNDNGKYVWASGVTANNGEKVLAYLNENAEALSRAISAIKQ